MKPETRLKKEKEQLSERFSLCKRTADARLTWAIETLNGITGDNAFSILNKIERRLERVFDAVEDLEDLLADLEEAGDSAQEVKE